MRRKTSRQPRIIGGQWRGSKLPVPDIDGLRPTPDRVRETLFNWLAGDCPGANVLDCFAGSGALGFEALSRGAGFVTMIEKDKYAYKNLQQQVDRLQADGVQLMHGDVLELIPNLDRKYDLVFIDPPYALASMRQQVMSALEAHQRLHQGAKIYFEWPQDEVFDSALDNLTWLKQKKAGQVNYAIAEWRVSR
ncbi:MAG: 16S rRNA (guanine(966)-N(2))-methyltransferase RsmD [Proteobacteria bacterium]|nr:16S rRNA (guanine(966)-N(2))-methyltransferase RsmD [Pseudomonadota bacterium]MCH8176907.1 16S rRNA (guanine(966)-N(2))-methyltransferase RsmD [Pseudomonadota bacterium]